MLRPNRIGPWPFADIEVPPWEPGATLLAAIDDVAAPQIGAGVRSVTVPDNTNYESIYIENKTMVTAGGVKTMIAFGCLINGTNRKDDVNTIYTVTGNARLSLDAADGSGYLFPVISKLDATPSDPDALITLTDYSILPMALQDNYAGLMFYSTVNTQVMVGNVRGSTSSQSDLPIFVGWAFYNSDTANYVLWDFLANIGVYKYTRDLNIEDPWR